MRLRPIRQTYALVALSLLMAACAAPTPTEIPIPAVPSTAVSVPTGVPAQPSTAGNTPPAVAATPTARSGQEATDPKTVNLASGKPTLVKFFAFW